MRKVIGILIIINSLFWIWYYGHMVLDELLPSEEIIHCFRPPIYISIVNLILVIIMGLIGWNILKKRIKNWVAISALIVISIMGFLVDSYGYLLM